MLEAYSESVRGGGRRCGMMSRTMRPGLPPISAAACVMALVALHGACTNSHPAGAIMPQPTATAEPTPVPCADPLPPPLSRMNTAILLRTGLYWTLDSTPIVSDRSYCAAIG